MKNCDDIKVTITQIPHLAQLYLFNTIYTMNIKEIITFSSLIINQTPDIDMSMSGVS